MEKILIIGKTPPPIGGVTIHVSRLIENLLLNNYPYCLYDLNNGIKKRLFIKIYKAKRAHLHTSNSVFRLFAVIISKLFNTQIILTFHGNLGRYNHILNLIDKLSLKWCYLPIVLNNFSYTIARDIHKSVKLISAFIPPLKISPLPHDTLKKVKSFTGGRKIICTNASDISFDKNGAEIYGISTLLDVCSNQNKYSLVISDPSGNYREYIGANHYHLLSHAFWLNFPHDFYSVLNLSYAFVRNTTTDGDAISVREALHLGKLTLATGVVDRPKGTIIYEDVGDIFNIMKYYAEDATKNALSSTIHQLIAEYERQ